VTGGRRKRGLLLALCGSLALLFAGLGLWQVERLRWKLDLIARVDARLAAPPVAVPAAAEWNRLDPRDSEYLRVRAEGTFDHRRTTFVDALTKRGAGNWIVTPLMTADGTILVNRGFAPKGWTPPAAAADEAARQMVTGLLRLSEPEGRVLRPNRPADDAWYSRDVEAIAEARGLEEVAPFFIDAAAGKVNAGYPVPGLTVVHFRNAHLVYALTWFGLAALCLFGLALTLRSTQNKA
jgi:surfeit locus 1 family protein